MLLKQLGVRKRRTRSGRHSRQRGSGNAVVVPRSCGLRARDHIEAVIEAPNEPGRVVHVAQCLSISGSGQLTLLLGSLFDDQSPSDECNVDDATGLESVSLSAKSRAE